MQTSFSAGIEVAYKHVEGDGGVGFRRGAGRRIICSAFGEGCHPVITAESLHASVLVAFRPRSGLFSARLGETYENAFAQVAGIFQLEVGDDHLVFVNLDFGGIGLVVCATGCHGSAFFFEYFQFAALQGIDRCRLRHKDDFGKLVVCHDGVRIVIGGGVRDGRGARYGGIVRGAGGKCAKGECTCISIMVAWIKSVQHTAKNPPMKV